MSEDDLEQQSAPTSGGSNKPGGHIARMHAAAAAAFTRRKQVAISAPAWNDWLIISKLEYVPGEYSLFKATQAAGQHLGAEIYFEAASLRGVRVF